MEGRYVGASQALDRIFALKVRDHQPPVHRLEVHLEGEELVNFRVLFLQIMGAGSAEDRLRQ